MFTFKSLCCLLSIGLIAELNSPANAFKEFADNPEADKAKPSLNFWMSQKKKTKEIKTESFLNAQGSNREETFNNPRSTEELRQLLEVREIEGSVPITSTPSSTLGVPTAYGAQWGNAWVGGAFSSSRLFESSSDGSIAFGLGFGDAKKAVGLEVFSGIFNLQGSNNSDLGGRAGNGGAVGFKLHRLLDNEGYFAAAVGMTNVIRWGQENTYGGNYDTYFGVLTRRFDLQPDNFDNPLPLIFSVGLGTGSFRSKGALDAEEQNVNVFASAGLRVIPEVSLITTWMGSQLNMGTSLAPFSNLPLVINLGAADVTSVYPEGTRFIMSLGYGFRF